MIARSQIVVADRTPRRRLPAGFDDVDIAILDWIAAEGRRVGRSLVRHVASPRPPSGAGSARYFTL